jgi:hypothetical protein
MKLTSLSAILILLLAGCAGDGDGASAQSSEPIGVQLMRVSPELKNQRFSALLNFESPTDVAFVAAQPSVGKVDSKHAHTGKSSLLLPANTKRVAIKLAAIMGDRPFPADWTLAGVYLWTSKPSDIVVRYVLDAQPVAQTKLHVSAGKWTAAVTELEPTPPPGMPMNGVGTLEIEFPDGAGAGCRIDDVLLVENQQTLFDGGEIGAMWNIKRRGLHLIVERQNAFRFFLDTTEMNEQGWEADEVGQMRARFHSGKNNTLTLYTDGRAYRDGKYQPVRSHNEDPMFAAQHEVPAGLRVAPEFGRVDRRSAGDANNDGYNETRGAYQLIASGNRMEFSITPATPSLIRPVLEIANLPEGKVVATVEGRLVENIARTTDGHVLIELPTRIERATTINVNVQ